MRYTIKNTRIIRLYSLRRRAQALTTQIEAMKLPGTLCEVRPRDLDAYAKLVQRRHDIHTELHWSYTHLERTCAFAAYPCYLRPHEQGMTRREMLAYCLSFDVAGNVQIGSSPTVTLEAI